MSVAKVNLEQKFRQFDDQWSPKIAGEVNDSYVKPATEGRPTAVGSAGKTAGANLVKFQGDFVWHQHDAEDEMFLVVRGRFTMRFRDRDVVLEENEFLIVPRGVEHCPVAEKEAHVLLFEPKTTLNTGNVVNERTLEKLDRI